MALFRSRTTKPVAVAEAPVAEPAQTAKAASAKKTETTATHGAAKNGRHLKRDQGNNGTERIAQNVLGNDHFF